MTWEELVEKAKYYNCEHYSENWFDFRGITFWKDGEITCGDEIIAESRTNEQMYQIMIALES